jgi:TatA/E family protein of Tat protein translocase
MLLTTLFLFLGNPKTIILIIFILVIFFGAKRIPELFRGVGQGVREFKDASNPEPQQPNPNYNQQPGHNQGGYPQQYAQNGYPQQPSHNQQPQQYPQNGYPQQPTGYNPNGNPQQYGQMPQAPYNPNNTPAS